MRRREVITLLGGTAAWPLAARAQGERMRRIGVLSPYREDDPLAKANHSAFIQGLVNLGWTDGRNLRIDVRWTNGNLDLAATYAKELVNLHPDAILSDSTP